MQNVEILINAIKALSQADDMESLNEIVKTAARKLPDADGATFILKESRKCYNIGEDLAKP